MQPILASSLPFPCLVSQTCCKCSKCCPPARAEGPGGGGAPPAAPSASGAPGPHASAHRRRRAAAAPPPPPRPLRLRRPGLGRPLLCTSRASLPCAGEVLQRQHALRAQQQHVFVLPLTTGLGYSALCCGCCRRSTC
jgi:hypothetical protein